MVSKELLENCLEKNLNNKLKMDVNSLLMQNILSTALLLEEALRESNEVINQARGQTCTCRGDRVCMYCQQYEENEKLLSR